VRIDPLTRPAIGAVPTQTLPSFCLWMPDVIAVAVRRRDWLGAVGQAVAEVLGLEDVAELLRAPVGHEELQPGAVAQAAVAVVAEDADDPGPDVGDLLEP
jgi:hypothetical protein